MEREGPGPLAPLFIRFFFFLPLGLPYVNWASQGCCLFHLRSSLWSCTSLCSIFIGFSLPCLLATVILDSFFLFSLPNISTSRDWRPSSLVIGHQGLSGYFLMNWDGEGHWASPFASLKTQSPYSSVHLRVSDIFCGWL